MIFSLKFTRFNNLNKSEKISYLFFLVNLLIIIFIYFNLYSFSGGNIYQALDNPKVYFHITFVFIQFFMLYLSGKISLYSRYSIYLRIGISIWIIGKAFNLADEISKHTSWDTSYLGDVLTLFGMLILSVSGYKKIKNLERLYSKANMNAMHDDLTSLPNRRFFTNTLKSNKNKHLGLILIDIDFFKSINDMYGHAHGDKVLKEFGNLLSSYSSVQCTPARIGGEEFAILIKDAHIQQIENYAKKIISDTSEIIIDKEKRLSVSIGIGMIKKKESTEQLIKRTDKALYIAKNKGRGKIELSI